MSLMKKVLADKNIVAGNLSGNFGEGADLVKASTEYADAQVQLNDADVESQTLGAAMNQVSETMETANAVAGTESGDAMGQAIMSTGIVCASITMGGTAADVQDVVDGNLSASDFFGKIVEAAKDAAKKVWEFIRNLLNKGADLIAGIIGSNGTSGKVLVDKLKKLKKDGKTNLGDAEFSKATQERLAKLYPVLIGSKLDFSGISKFIQDTAGKVEDETALETSRNDLNLSLKSIADLQTIFKTNGNDSNMVAATAGAANEILTDLLKLSAKTVYESSVTDAKDYLDTDAIDKEIGEVYHANVRLIVCTAKKAYLTAVIITDAGHDKIKDAEKLLNGLDLTDNDNVEVAGKIASAINKLSSALTFKGFKVDFDETEALDTADKIEPMVFSDCMDIAKLLDTSSKNVEKRLRNMKKMADKVEKDNNKKIDDTTAANSEKDGTRRIFGKVALDYSIRENKKTMDLYRLTTEAITAAGMELVKSPFDTFINESVRLMKK